MRIVLKPGCVFALLCAIVALAAVILRQGSASPGATPASAGATPAAASPAPRVSANPDGSISLLANEAELHGTGLQKEAKSGVPNIGYWSNVSDWVAWQLPPSTSGAYRVSLCYASDDRSAVDVGMDGGGSTLGANLVSTGDFANFRTVSLGRISAKSGTTHTLTIRPQSAATWHAVNIRYITLTPSK